MKHASIVPLIGGETIGNEIAFGTLPEYLLSYSPFVSNDSHLVNYYAQRGAEIPYHLLDTDGDPGFSLHVDSLSSVCPCAGLSSLSVSSSADSEKNDWMIKTAEYALSTVKPTVYWGENAPGLFSDKGAPVRDRLQAVADKYGYSVSYYRTKSLLHGVPQVRNRSFFFFWKGDSSPLLSWYSRPYQKIEDLISGVKSNFQMEPLNEKTPSRDDLYYRFVLEEVHGGITHREFSEKMKPMPVRSNDAQGVFEAAGYTYSQVSDWLRKQGYDKQADRCLAIEAKLKAGGSIMRRSTVVPNDYIGAYVGHYPHTLTHPVEDRYITHRESMTIMGLPDDFELLNPKKNYNHVCQNVPVQTATDVASAVKTALEDPSSVEWVKSPTVFQNNLNKTVEKTALRSTLDSFF